MKQPIHTAQEECNCHLFELPDGVEHMPNCKGKTTKLIFLDKGFKCPIVNFAKGEKEHSKNCECKGTGYILPKKGDVIEIENGGKER